MASINLDPLYQVLKIVTDIMPIGVTIGLVLFVIGLIFYMILGKAGGGKLVNSLRIDKKMLYPMIALQQKVSLTCQLLFMLEQLLH